MRVVPLPDLKGGEALVRVKLINIHANTRMNMATRYTRLGETEAGNYACAEVIDSRSPTFKEGEESQRKHNDFGSGAWEQNRYESLSHPLFVNPSTKKSRAIPEFDAFELANCKKRGRVATSKRHL